MSPPLRASNEVIRGRALREHGELTGPSLPLMADCFSILSSSLEQEREPDQTHGDDHE